MRAASGNDQYKKKTPSAKAGNVWIFRSSPIETGRTAAWDEECATPRQGGLLRLQVCVGSPQLGCRYYGVHVQLPAPCYHLWNLLGIDRQQC